MKSTTALLLLSLSMPVAADGFQPGLGHDSDHDSDHDHDHVEIGFYRGGTAEENLDLDVIDLRTTRGFGNWIVTAAYEQVDFEPVDVAGQFRLEAGNTILRLGAGYRIPLTGAIDLVPRAGFARARSHVDLIEQSSGNDVSVIPDRSDTGYFAGLGLFADVGAGFALGFEHRFTNVLSERLNDSRLELRYAFSRSMEAGIGYRDFEGDTAYGAMLRWRY